MSTNQDKLFTFLSTFNNSFKNKSIYQLIIHLQVIYIYIYICSSFNKFPDFFVQAFKIVVDS